MDFKQVLLKETPVEYRCREPKFVQWSELDFDIVKPYEPTKEHLYKPKEYETLCNNDRILYDLTDELKEKFEFKGLLQNCNMLSLLETVIKYMKCEEIETCADDEDFTSEEDENYF